MAKLKRGKGTTTAQKQWYVMDKNKDRRAAVPAEEPLGYEYTWAWDMATVTASTGHNEPGNFDTLAYEYTNPSTGGVGFRVMDTSSSTSQLQWNDAMLDNTTHSAGTGGMPDDSIPIPPGETSHPGRYLSWVITIDQFDITSPTTIQPASWQLQTRGGSGLILGLPFFPGGYGLAYVDGVAVTQGTWGVQGDYDALIGKISTITYDISAAQGVFAPDDDPSSITLHPVYHQTNGVTAVVDYDMTFHGAIFSATPPNVTSLPVHTSSPSM
jgi:hypothetical protein